MKGQKGIKKRSLFDKQAIQNNLDALAAPQREKIKTQLEKVRFIEIELIKINSI